jgi:hypothetical protein
MKTRLSAPASLSDLSVPQPWPGVEPEALEDVARSLCARRPGSRAAERLMERAAYLRAIRTPTLDGPRSSSALLFA